MKGMEVKDKSYLSFVINKDSKFRELENYSNYLVDIVNGRVWNKTSGKYLIANPTKQTGYVLVGLRDNDGQMRTIGLHEVVMAAYYNVQPKSWIPYDLEVNHIDHDKSNNTIDNLELVTRKQQYDTYVRQKMGGNKRLTKPEKQEILQAYHIYNGKASVFINQVAFAVGISRRSLSRIVNGK
ncbi:hypothetical protein GCM10028778_11880 [Barrientosiimonas marina]|uniref:HNH endonuclease signature motif containing protein n=1 Tax=Lentibacillus kimchii TaxID=1542911 RepID=A0ABW2UZA1_9BACI